MFVHNPPQAYPHAFIGMPNPAAVTEVIRKFSTFSIVKNTTTAIAKSKYQKLLYWAQRKLSTSPPLPVVSPPTPAASNPFIPTR